MWKVSHRLASREEWCDDGFARPNVSRDALSSMSFSRVEDSSKENETPC